MGDDEPVFSAFSGSATAGIGFNPAGSSSVAPGCTQRTCVLANDSGGGSEPVVLSPGTMSSNFLFLVARTIVERESVNAIPLFHMVRRPVITHKRETKTDTP